MSNKKNTTNGNTKVEEVMVAAVRTPEVNKALAKAQKIWIKGGCSNSDILQDIQDLGMLFNRYNTPSKNAVLKAIQKVSRFVDATDKAIKDVLQADVEALKAKALRTLGTGVTDAEMRSALDSFVAKNLTDLTVE